MGKKDLEEYNRFIFSCLSLPGNPQILKTEENALFMSILNNAAHFHDEINSTKVKIKVLNQH